MGQGVSGVAIHAALCREHGYTGSYSAIYRLIQSSVNVNRMRLCPCSSRRRKRRK